MPPYVSSYVVTPVAHRGSCNFAPAPLRPYSKVVQNLRYCLLQVEDGHLQAFRKWLLKETDEPPCGGKSREGTQSTIVSLTVELAPCFAKTVEQMSQALV